MILWDENALEFLHFETLFYLQEDLREAAFRENESLNHVLNMQFFRKSPKERRKLENCIFFCGNLKKL